MAKIASKSAIWAPKVLHRGYFFLRNGPFRAHRGYFFVRAGIMRPYVWADDVWACIADDVWALRAGKNNRHKEREKLGKRERKNFF